MNRLQWEWVEAHNEQVKQAAIAELGLLGYLEWVCNEALLPTLTYARCMLLDMRVQNATHHHCWKWNSAVHRAADVCGGGALIPHTAHTIRHFLGCLCSSCCLIQIAPCFNRQKAQPTHWKYHAVG